MLQPGNLHRSKNTPTDLGFKAKAVCNTVVPRIEVYTSVDHRQSDGTWVSVTGFNMRSVTTWPAYKKAVGQSFTGCTRGTFRGRAYARVLWKGTWVTIPTVYAGAATNVCG